MFIYLFIYINQMQFFNADLTKKLYTYLCGNKRKLNTEYVLNNNNNLKF